MTTTPTHRGAQQHAHGLLAMAPIDAVGHIRWLVENGRAEALRLITRQPEHVAEHAAWLARYTDARGGNGYPDDGHDAAVTRANRAARAVWVDALGYADHMGLTL